MILCICLSVLCASVFTASSGYGMALLSCEVSGFIFCSFFCCALLPTAYVASMHVVLLDTEKSNSSKSTSVNIFGLF